MIRHYHIEAAKDISKIIPIEIVLEFGVGEISTISFLNKENFPNLKKLITVEFQKKWVDEITKLVGCDTRWNMIITKNETIIPDINEKINIVLVDSLTIEGRIALLTQLNNLNFYDFIILHDSQHTSYNSIISKFMYSYKYSDGIYPEAAILSNNKEFKYD